MLKSQFRKVSSSKRVRILRWPEPETWSQAFRAPSIEQGIRERVALSHKIKQPILERIAAIPGATVTNPLEGTLQAIVETTPEAWKRITDPSDPIVNEAVIEVSEIRFVPLVR